MGALASATPVIVICTRDLPRATVFYRDVLGLTLIAEEARASVFDLGGVEMRVSTVPDFTAHGHTILGFRVADVAAAVRALSGKGVVFNRYPHFPQDEDGILTLPGGAQRVAWLSDPDGNVLSVTDG